MPIILRLLCGQPSVRPIIIFLITRADVLSEKTFVSLSLCSSRAICWCLLSEAGAREGGLVSPFLVCMRRCVWHSNVSASCTPKTSVFLITQRKCVSGFWDSLSRRLSMHCWRQRLCGRYWWSPSISSKAITFVFVHSDTLPYILHHMHSLFSALMSFHALSLLINSPISPPLPDEGQTICYNPPELAGQRLAEVGMQLRADCHQGLGYWDYLFFIAIGFVIFSAGTVSAWVMGVLMVLYERYSKRKSEELDSEDEQERGPMNGSGGGGNQGNGDLSKPNMQVWRAAAERHPETLLEGKTDRKRRRDEPTPWNCLSLLVADLDIANAL